MSNHEELQDRVDELEDRVAELEKLLDEGLDDIAAKVSQIDSKMSVIAERQLGEGEVDA